MTNRLIGCADNPQRILGDRTAGCGVLPSYRLVNKLSQLPCVIAMADGKAGQLPAVIRSLLWYTPHSALGGIV